MSTWKDDPFEVVVVEEAGDAFAELTRRGVASAADAVALDEQPRLADLPGLPHEIVSGRTTVALLREQIGSTVVVLFEQGDVRRPIVVGVLQPVHPTGSAPVPAPLVSAQVDDQRVVLSAEREIVLKCGEASITLTRAGNVLIKGTYVLSRSSGVNKIKGAAVDIN
jgi:hypothetical protein